MFLYQMAHYLALFRLDPCVCVCVWVWLCVCVCSCTFYKMGTTYYYIFIGKVRTLCLLLLNVFAGILSLDEQHANSMEAATVM